jgi:lactate permease
MSTVGVLESVLLQVNPDAAIPGAEQAGALQLFAAMLPLLVAFGLLVGLLWPATRAMPVAWLVAFLVGYFVWQLPVDWLVASSIDGIITALTILFIVAGALVLLYTMLQAGALQRINEGFAAISEDRRVQIVLLGFFMSTFIEGAAGFGTPAAVVAPLLLGLGFPALAAVIAALIGHIIAVTYGAVGTPIIVGIEQPMSTGRYPEAIAEGGFTEAIEYANSVAAWAATYHALVGFLMPLLAVGMVVYFFGEERSIKPALAVAPLCLFAGISFVIPYWISAWFITAEFPSLIGSMVGVTLTVGMLRAGYLEPDDTWEFPDRDSWADHWVGDIEPGGEEMDTGGERMSLLRAWSPYLILVVLLVTTRAWDWLGEQITNPDVGVDIGAGGLGEFTFGIVLIWDDILGTGIDNNISWISVPGFWLFLTAIIAIGIFGMPGTRVKAAWREAGEKLVSPFVALVFVIAMVQIMLNAGGYYGIEGFLNGDSPPPVVLEEAGSDIWRNANMIEVLAVTTAETLGQAYPFFAALIGSLGSAMTGSNTVSNLTFTQFQFTAAQQLDVSTQVVVGAQAVGGAMGNLIAIHNVVAALATVGLVGQEGRVMRLNMIPLAYYAFFAGLLTMLFAFVLFPVAEVFTLFPGIL